jgi:four helix bundle protein
LPNSYRDLIAWQKAFSLVTDVYRDTDLFPKMETYGLTSQIRRAAVSVVCNIAEGQGRNSRGEFEQFLGHAKGSLSELETQLLLANALGYLSKDRLEELLARCDAVSRLINGLLQSLRGAKPSSEKRETRNAIALSVSSAPALPPL